jgi:hypothetical protein
MVMKLAHGADRASQACLASHAKCGLSAAKAQSSKEAIGHLLVFRAKDRDAF